MYLYDHLGLGLGAPLDNFDLNISNYSRLFKAETPGKAQVGGKFSY